MLSQLASRLACVKSNATQLVDRLEAEKLVCRLPDETDRRSIRAEITPQGRRAYALGQAIVTAFEEQILGACAPEEQLVLRQMLARMGQAGSLT